MKLILIYNNEYFIYPLTPPFQKNSQTKTPPLTTEWSTHIVQTIS